VENDDMGDFGGGDVDRRDPEPLLGLPVRRNLYWDGGCEPMSGSGPSGVTAGDALALVAAEKYGPGVLVFELDGIVGEDVIVLFAPAASYNVPLAVSHVGVDVADDPPESLN
jgi:hypothetical protein